MFSFGIFTTHIPYIAFVAFYAYFLLFGVESGNNGNSPVVDHSVQIEQHVTNFQPCNFSSFEAQKQVFAAIPQQIIFSCQLVNRQWKRCYQHPLHPQNFIDERPFCRPPPVWA